MASFITDFHGCEETIKKGGIEGTLYISKQSKRISTLKNMAEVKGLSVKEISLAEMDKMATKGHRGFVLKIANFKIKSESKKDFFFESFLNEYSKQDGLIVVLDSITDPHNYGAILRSCDQFNVDAVVVPSRRSASETPVVLRVSAGAVNYVNIAVVPNLNRALKQIKDAGFWVYGADMGGESAPKMNLSGRICIVMGSEGKGLHEKIRENCDGIISIPTKGNIDSLNVSVATGVLLYEVKRQQWQDN